MMLPGVMNEDPLISGALGVLKVARSRAAGALELSSRFVSLFRCVPPHHPTDEPLSQLTDFAHTIQSQTTTGEVMPRMCF
jgi:hypothetical protein